MNYSIVVLFIRFGVTGSGTAATIKPELRAFTQVPNVPYFLPLDMIHTPNFNPVQNWVFLNTDESVSNSVQVIKGDCWWPSQLSHKQLTKWNFAIKNTVQNVQKVIYSPIYPEPKFTLPRFWKVIKCVKISWDLRRGSTWMFTPTGIK